MTDGPISDPKALRALSHPFRWKLINLLTEEGPCTATQCAAVLGESVASCSYHLNMLAKYGFVAEVEGPGRQKPWKIISRRQMISSEGLEGEAAMAAETAVLAYLDHEFERTRRTPPPARPAAGRVAEGGERHRDQRHHQVPHRRGDR